MDGYEIKRIVYGKSVLPESMIYQGGNPDKVQPIDFAVFIVKGDNFLLLIDAGCETMPEFVMEDFTGSVRALESEGITVSDVTDVFITHSHHDHIENVKYFKKAKIHIQSDELESGRKYIKNNENVCTFDEVCDLYDGIRLVKIGGHSKGSSVAEIKVRDKIYVVAADECYKREVLDNGLITGQSCNIQNSRNFTEKYRDDKYTVLLSHEG